MYKQQDDRPGKGVVTNERLPTSWLSSCQPAEGAAEDAGALLKCGRWPVAKACSKTVFPSQGRSTPSLCLVRQLQGNAKQGFNTRPTTDKYPILKCNEGWPDTDVSVELRGWELMEELSLGGAPSSTRYLSPSLTDSSVLSPQTTNNIPAYQRMLCLVPAVDEAES
jgi:hypothetical protein